MSRLMLLLSFFLATPALAQDVHAGLTLDALPSGITVLDVRAPDVATGAARVRLSTDGHAPAALLDVWVRSTEADARAAYDTEARTTSSAVLTARSDLGEAAVADLASGASLVVFRRDNVVVSLRSIATQFDVEAVARALDLAIQHAPSGATAAAGTPARQADGEALLVSLPGALDLVLVGDSVTHRAVDWRAIGHGEIFWVDDHLRVGHATY